MTGGSIGDLKMVYAEYSLLAEPINVDELVANQVGKGSRTA